MSGKRRKIKIDQKCEDNYLYNGQHGTSRCIKTVIIFPPAFCLQHRDQRISQISFRKLGPLLDPVTTRWDKHACGKPMLTDHDKQATGNLEPADETNKESPTQGILVWLQPFTVCLEDLEAYVLAHSSARELCVGR